VLYEDQAVLSLAYKRCGYLDYTNSKQKNSIQKSVDNLTRDGYLRRGPGCTAYLDKDGLIFVEEASLLKHHTARMQDFRARYDAVEAEFPGDKAAIARLDAEFIAEGYSPEEIRGLKRMRAILRGTG